MANDSPLRPIVTKWKEAIRRANERKQTLFGQDAKEAMQFYNGPHDFLYKPGYGRKSRGFVQGTDDEFTPSFGMTVNKAAECVQIFGPVLYHKNPIRKVNPRKPPMLPIEVFGPPDDPMVQQQFLMTKMQVDQIRGTDAARASLLEFYLNYTPNALGLKDHCRAAIDEALIKGMGLIYTEVYKPKGMDISMVGSFYDTVDNLQMDPDAETIHDCQWIARRCIHPVWMVERDYGLPRGTLRGSIESINRQGDGSIDEELDFQRRLGRSNDLVVYWKIYSKMGIGARLAGVTPAIRNQLEQFGDYVYLVICDECPYPLNLPPKLTETATDIEVLLEAVQWPTPFWADDEWPFTPIQFHPVPRQIWPMGHLKPAMGELKFLDWCYSFLASKIRIISRDFLAIQKSAAEELKNAVLSGSDYTLLEIEKHHGTISDVVQFIQHPQFNASIIDVLRLINDNFDKRTGLTELAYGLSTRQLRSASEAELKSENLKVRPDDMASRVEEAMTMVSRKEALAARWHLSANDVGPIMGPMGARWWQQLLEASDPAEILCSLEYRIEANSTKKPNYESRRSDMNQAIQTLLPILMPYAQATGDIAPVNALMADWATANDIEPERYLMSPPPPPPSPMEPAPAGPPEAAGPSGPPPQ